MIAPRWRKVLRDVGGTPVQTTLAIVAMAAGIAGVGAILASSSILERELPRGYGATHPASAILAGGGIDDGAVAAVRLLPGIRDAEARPVLRGRIRVEGDRWAPLLLFVVRDFTDLRVDTIAPDAGAWPPADDEVLLERTALPVARTSIGAAIAVRGAGGVERRLRVAGTVHAAGLPPAWMDHVVTGFVTWRSAVREAGSESSQLRIVVAERTLDEGHIRDVARLARASLERRGATVARIDVPPPGRHPHADQMDTFLFLLGTFGLLALLLGAILVAEIVRALLAGQLRQVGIMKAIGATSGQIAGIYLGQVALLASISLAVGIPLGASAGRGYARFSASILNADLASVAVPLRVFALEGAIGLALPLAASLWPVLRASRLTIHETLGDGLGLQPFGTRPLDRRIARIAWLPRPLILSARTTLRRPGRLALTVLTLAAGGAAFMSALNVSREWSRAVGEEFGARHDDLEVRLSRPFPVASLAEALKRVPGVERAESWSEAEVAMVEADGAEGTRLLLVGPERGSTLLDLPILKGRWLADGDERSAVVNQALLARAPHLHVGGDLLLRARGRMFTFRIVGVAKELQPTPIAYAPAPGVLEASGMPEGTTRSLRVVARGHDEAGLASLSRDLDRALESAGARVLDVGNLLDRRKAIEDHLVIVRSALLFAAGLIVLVGGIGLTSALALGVAERTREIGILGALGAAPRTIALHVVVEGLLIGLLSWVAALLAAAPATAAVGSAAGRIFFKAPLGFYMSPAAAFAWLGLVVVLAPLAALVPAHRASHITVKEALAYE